MKKYTPWYVAIVITFTLTSFCLSSCSGPSWWWVTDPIGAIQQLLDEQDEISRGEWDQDLPPQDPPAAEVPAPAVENSENSNQPPVENPAPPPAQEQPVEPAAPAAPPEQPPASASPATVVGGWYGAYCDEAEGTFYYRWSVDLMQNPADGSYAGTVKFHNCPGGGRVAYRVTGPAQPGLLITLTGVKKDGGGDLYKNAAETLAFSFDLSSGQITPNLSP